MLLDTSGVLCLYNQNDPRHTDAQAFYEAAPVCITHSYVLAEFVALAYARNMPKEGALGLVIDLQDDPEVEVVWVDEGLHREGVTL